MDKFLVCPFTGEMEASMLYFFGPIPRLPAHGGDGQS